MSPSAATVARGSVTLPRLPFEAHNIHQMFTGIEVPDPITFVVGEQWCNRPNLYPRQATLLKIIFLRDDLFTEFDLEVIEEWEEAYRRTGNNGIVPNIRFRIRLLKRQGYKWFREVLLVMGRRAGKGHVTALAMAYVLWNYMAKGDPQGFYGIDRDKRLACLVFAGKRDQAKATVFGDLVNVITGSTCFAPYVSSYQVERLSLYAPHDFLRMRRLAAKGIVTQRDMATFEVLPKESTPMAGRGPTSFMQCLDPATPVLTADLRWVPIGDLRPGDEIVGVDEEPPTTGAHRKMRRAVVEAAWRTRKQALRIRFDDGSEVVCSTDHRWLVKDLGKGGSYRWRTADGLHPGHSIRYVVAPWEEDQTWSGGYLAGMYDGEGCVSGWRGRNGKDVIITQKPGVVLDQTLGVLRDKGYEPVLMTGAVGSRSAEQWSLGTVADSMRFLGSVRPTRLMDRARGVWEDVALRGGRTSGGRERSASRTIVSVEPLPEQDLVDITTTTRTFIANGLVSHNCWDEMAHVVTGSVGRSVDEVYDAAKPSLDQFGKDAFIVEPSSPWQMMGKFYENYKEAIAVNDDGDPVRPNYMMIQLASWDVYLDWERAYILPLFPDGFEGDLGEYAHLDSSPRFHPLRGAIQVFDDEMEREKAANPETFAVERECLDPETRVLKDDLTWVPIKDIRAGDRVVSIDEEPPGGRKERRLRTATVVATKTNRNVAYRIDFEDGTHVICSGNHRWLSMSAGSGGSARWRSLFAAPKTPGPRQMIRVGDRIRQLTEPWDTDRSYEAGYLAGVYDGEGSVVFRDRSEYRIDFPQNPGAVLTKTLETLDRLGFKPTRAQPEASRLCQRYKITGMSECMRFLGQVRPARLLEQGVPLLWEGRALGKDGGRAMAKTITAITELPEQELVDLETSTGTFIAEGLISHNSHFATALDAYLNSGMVERIFQPWEGRPAKYGPPRLTVQNSGLLVHTYKGHADPSKVNDKFGFALAHVEIDEQGRWHCVFDQYGCFYPSDFEGNIIDYEYVDDWLWDNIIKRFYPEEFTFDQYNSTSSIQKMQKRVRQSSMPKHINIFEKTVTRPYDWMVKENAKAAINLELVHAPADAKDYEVASGELRFLQLVNGRVDHPTAGPIQSKDIADSMMECIHVLIGEQTKNFIHSDLQGLRPGAASLGQPFPGMTDGEGSSFQDQQRINAMSSFSRARGNMDGQRIPGRRGRY